MLLRRILIALGIEHLQTIDQLLARFSRTNHGVHVTTLCRDIGISKTFAELLYLLTALALENLPALGFGLDRKSVV